MKSMLVFLTMTMGCSTALHAVAAVSEGAAYASLACDAGSTHWAIHSGEGYMEVNPVMGASPSGNEVAGYFAAVGTGVFAMNRAFSHGQSQVAGDVWRIVTNATVVVLEQSAIRGNHDAGVPLCGY